MNFSQRCHHDNSTVLAARSLRGLEPAESHRALSGLLPSCGGRLGGKPILTVLDPGASLCFPPDLAANSETHFAPSPTQLPRREVGVSFSMMHSFLIWPKWEARIPEAQEAFAKTFILSFDRSQSVTFLCDVPMVSTYGLQRLRCGLCSQVASHRALCPQEHS